MKYLLDTNHCSYIQQKRPEVLAHLQTLPPETEIVTSVITQGELLAGIELITSERRKQELQNLYQTILALFLSLTHEFRKPMLKFSPICDRKASRSPPTICGLLRLPKPISSYLLRTMNILNMSKTSRVKIGLSR